MATKKISDEDLAWLQAYKQNVERRTRMLKGIDVFLYCLAFGFALATSVALAVSPAVAFAFIAFIVFLALAAILIVAHPPDKYAGEIVAGTISGFIIGIIIALIYIAPMASVAQYPISMQVFYPNHPNITITQNCTAFTTSALGYLNGQPINPQNTTQCNLPQSMALDYSNPFNCNISSKNITCTGYLDENVTWKGTILNISKR